MGLNEEEQLLITFWSFFLFKLEFLDFFFLLLQVFRQQILLLQASNTLLVFSSELEHCLVITHFVTQYNALLLLDSSHSLLAYLKVFFAFNQ
jgi:hypothetical protein